MSRHDEIAKVAQELFEKSGRVPARDLENWLEAERIVKARYGNGGNGKEEGTEAEEPKTKRRATVKAGAKKTEVKKTTTKRTKKSE